MRGGHKRAVIATADQVAASKKDWKATKQEPFVDVADVERLTSQLGRLLSEQPLSDLQRTEAKNSALALLTALSTGNYDAFMKARVPSPDFTISDEVVEGLHRYSGIARNAAPLEHYKAIWQATFQTNALWKQVFLSPTNGVTLEASDKQLDHHLDFPKFMTATDGFYMHSFVSSAFHYGSLEAGELHAKGELLILKLFFMAKCQPQDGPRPFMISFFWSSSVGRWLPIECSHAFVDNPKVRFRFF